MVEVGCSFALENENFESVTFGICYLTSNEFEHQKKKKPRFLVMEENIKNGGRYLNFDLKLNIFSHY
jgi:hypothetical protein